MDASGSSERSYGLTNIKAHIPVTLDLEDMNYTTWRKFIQMHCITNEAEGFLDGTTLPKGKDDKVWLKRDALVKMWIYNTISKPILQIVMKKSETAQDLWKAIHDLFQSNKDARAMQLHDDLRNISQGDLTISTYCHKIKVISDLLDNMDQPVDEKTLVMHTLNGLSAEYATFSTVLRIQKPLPSFIDTRSLLEMEESRISRSHTQTINRENSSSATVLHVKQNIPRGNSNDLCRNFQRGFCRFGEKCRYIHVSGGSNRSHGGYGTSKSSVAYPSFTQQQHSFPMQARPNNNNQQAHYGKGPRQFYYTSPINNSQQPSSFPTAPPVYHSYPQASSGSAHQPLGSAPPSNHSGQTGSLHPSTGTHPNPAAAFHTQNASTDEATTLPQAFTNMTFHDHGASEWYMDTGATSHLASNSGPSDTNNASSM